MLVSEGMNSLIFWDLGKKTLTNWQREVTSVPCSRCCWEPGSLPGFQQHLGASCLGNHSLNPCIISPAFGAVWKGLLPTSDYSYLKRWEFLETPGEIPITTSSVPENASTVNTDLILCLETYIQKQNELSSSRNDIKWFWSDDLDNFEVPSYVIYEFAIFSYAIFKNPELIYTVAPSKSEGPFENESLPSPHPSMTLRTGYKSSMWSQNPKWSGGYYSPGFFWASPLLSFWALGTLALGLLLAKP